MDSYRTMYARHRNAAGITQEKAAELLGCGHLPAWAGR